MTVVLRPYQADLNAGIRQAWNGGAANVLAVLATGGGKTVNMSELFAEHTGAAIGIAHRQELVGQMSLTLARNNVPHRIVGSPALARQIVTIHMAEVGRSFYNPQARIGVAGVDTLIRRVRYDDVERELPPEDPWLRQITLWQTDEAHHVLRENKWGKACRMFPNARGVGWTATPGRADGYGLGRTSDGVFDAMVQGPSMRWLIDNRYLTDYRVFCPPSDVDLSNVTVTASGDYSPPKLREAVHKSHIVGDIVEHYKRIAPGKLGITFAVDVEHAEEITRAFRAAGVRAEIVTSDTPDGLRASILRRFRNREIDQLVNVDLFGEGFDLPAIEVVSMGRPTASFNLFAQQFGRALRLLAGKSHGLIIDHVGNVLRHGLPDRQRSWSLGRRERRKAYEQSDVEPMRICAECTAPYSRFKTQCPYCGFEAEPPSRAAPEFVDGDLIELDPAVLADMRGEVERIDGDPPRLGHVDGIAQAGMAKQWRARQEAQRELRASIALWAGWQDTQGRDLHEQYRRFYHGFGVDVLSAQALGTPEATDLRTRIENTLRNAGVVEIAVDPK